MVGEERGRSEIRESVCDEEKRKERLWSDASSQGFKIAIERETDTEGIRQAFQV